MMTSKRLTQSLKQLVYIIIGSLFFLFLFAILIIPKPPVKEFNQYHEITNTINLKTNNDSNIFINAEFFRDEAYKEWQKQNEKSLLRKNYNESKRMILMAISIAEEINKDYNDTTNNK